MPGKAAREAVAKQHQIPTQLRAGWSRWATVYLLAV
jgi:hypothetical protein